ncbi:MAG TPA: MBL fold metallo-hydrolase [Gaiellaceae bacterium]|jgi:glyoxylase-like metal-dependent hydrolase (beta-lactamase superfamily II)|nr:MBL fold metallo-hydrolase [Gaiellaceae bacterium]
MTDVVTVTDAEGTFATVREAFGADDDSAWWLPFNAFLARTGDAIVLVDSGVGPPGDDPFLPDRAGRLPALLERAGVEPAGVDLVVFTHLHVDHVGWNMLDGEPFFPRARYIAHRADFDTFTTTRAERPYVRDQLIALHATGRLELIDESCSPLPGVSIDHAPGHTAGSCVITVGDATFLGDAAVHELQLADPGVGYMFEEDRDAAAAVRRRLFPALADAGGPVGIAHIGFGRIVRAGGGFAWEPRAEETGEAASN